VTGLKKRISYGFCVTLEKAGQGSTWWRKGDSTVCR